MPPAAAGRGPAIAAAAAVQVVVTASMRAALAALGYTAEEVAALDPAVAAEVIRRSTRRPATGTPASWLRPGAAATQRLRRQRAPDAAQAAEALGSPDLSEQTVVITGCSGGIGWHAAAALAALGANVVMGCRSADRAAQGGHPAQHQHILSSIEPLCV
jgi:hypothetical protein